MEHLEKSLNIFQTLKLTFTLLKGVRIQLKANIQNIKNRLKTLFG